MNDLEPILDLWRSLGEMDYVLGTVVEVEGSGYRKPGARMLIAADGRRAGTISGGCLESDVAKKAFWHTRDGAVVKRYATTAEDGEVPFGMGCGGVIHLLMERNTTANLTLERFAERFHSRAPLALATVLNGRWTGLRACWPASTTAAGAKFGTEQELEGLAERGFVERKSFSSMMRMPSGEAAKVWVEYRTARPGLFIFGAGDDAIPLVRQARQLGWFVAVADGHMNLATRARFPEANRVETLAPDWRFGMDSGLDLKPTDAVVAMTHSLDQDSAVLRALSRSDISPDYIGVLGPRRRTGEMVQRLAEESAGDPASNSEFEPVAELAERWMGRLHAPMGLDLGGDTPADVALAILAEIQLNRNRRSGKPLRQVRGMIAENPRSKDAGLGEADLGKTDLKQVDLGKTDGPGRDVFAIRA